MQNQQMRIAILVGLAVVIGVALYLILGHNGKHKPGASGTSVVVQKAVKTAGLKSEARQLGQSIYWAGPLRGLKYEFTLEKNGHVFVRYLPRKTPVGVRKANYLVIATYKYPGALKALKKVANGRGTSGPGGSFIYIRPTDPRSVLVAWPNVPYEVEVYDPRPAKAQTVAENGQLTAVG